MKKKLARLNAIAVALEELQAADATQAAKSVEDEKEVYALLADDRVLNEATEVEHQEQCQFMKEKAGVRAIFRVRRTEKTVPSKEVFYTLAIKMPRDEEGRRDQLELDVSEDVFMAFKQVYERAIAKTRYTLTVPNRPGKLEIDVVPGTKWVKIDYEFSEGEDRSFPELPAGFEQVIPGNSKDPEHRKIIDAYFEAASVAVS